MGFQYLSGYFFSAPCRKLDILLSFPIPAIHFVCPAEICCILYTFLLPCQTIYHHCPTFSRPVRFLPIPVSFWVVFVAIFTVLVAQKVFLPNRNTPKGNRIDEKRNRNTECDKRIAFRGTGR